MDRQQLTEIEERALTLLNHLISGSVERRQYVKSALSEMPQGEAVHTILHWLTYGKHLPETTVAGICAVTVYFTFFVPIMFHRTDWKFYILPSVLSFVVGALVRSIRSRIIRARCYEFLVNYDDVRITDVLVQALVKTAQPMVKVQAARALTKLLNRIKPSDGVYVSRASRNLLNDILLETDNADFVLAILAAWEQIGEVESIPIVERLSHGEGEAGGDARVREAACLAIPAIQAAAERAAVSDVLLRPSEPDDSANNLLRAAHPSHSDKTQALLYPTTSPSNTP